jgi:hypothetical protein
VNVGGCHKRRGTPRQRGPLTRESHGGSTLPAVLAYTSLAVIGVTWCLAVIGVGEAMRRRVTASLTLPAALGGAGG